jgi:hypothetical protein
MGFFPVQGITHSDNSCLQFSWFSLKTLHSVTMLLVSLFIMITIFPTMILKNVSNYISEYFLFVY